MPSYPLTALVLRHTKLGETDVIVTLLAEDGRQVRAVAKGLRKPGSRIGGRLEEFSKVDLLLHTGRNLDIVSEVRMLESRKGLRGDLERTAAAAVVADLLDKVSLDNQVEPRLFALADTALGVMERAREDALPALVTAFLVKAMAMSGYRPAVESCVACAGVPAGPGRFSLHSGGRLCEACGSVDPGALRVPAEALDWLAALLRATLAEVAEMELPSAAVADSFTLVRSFVGYHLPTRLKALDFYAGLVRT